VPLWAGVRVAIRMDQVGFISTGPHLYPQTITSESSASSLDSPNYAHNRQYETVPDCCQI
jgi:hypothetical protein